MVVIRMWGFNSQKWILDNSDTRSNIRHNSLVRTPIEVIQDFVERKENDLPLLCFKFWEIQTES